MGTSFPNELTANWVLVDEHPDRGDRCVVRGGAGDVRVWLRGRSRVEFGLSCRVKDLLIGHPGMMVPGICPTPGLKRETTGFALASWGTWM